MPIHRGNSCGRRCRPLVDSVMAMRMIYTVGETPGVQHGRHPGAGWLSVSRGLHVKRPDVDGDDRERLVRTLLAWQTLLRPMTAFTGLTSACLRGWWLPPLPDDLPVFASMIDGRNTPSRPGIIVTRHREITPSEVIDGVRVSLVGETLLACARVLGLIDLVVLIDCALHIEAITREELAQVSRQRRRGAPNLRRALALADGRSESAWETLLRLLHVICGINVEPQYEVFDEFGVFVARGDLWIVGSTMLHEFDGGDHLPKKQQRKDLRRARRIGNADWERRGYNSDDLLHQASSILRDADATVGRTHDPTRIRAWHDLLKDSLFTPAGTTRFRARVGLPQAESAAAS